MQITNNLPVATSSTVPADNCPAAKKNVTFYYAGGVYADVIERAFLQGSFDRAGKFDANWSVGNRPMHKISRGLWASRMPLQPDENSWEWRVALQLSNRGDSGMLHPGVMQDGGRGFDPRKQRALRYAPSELHRMGAEICGDNTVKVSVWAPNAQSVRVAFTTRQGQTQEFPLQPAGLPEGTGEGVWATKVHGEKFEPGSHAYEFLIETSKGEVLKRADPYATRFQGKQQGVSILYMNPIDGRPTDPCSLDNPVKLVNFELQNVADAQNVTLAFRNEAGQRLDADALGRRLGRLSELCRQADDRCDLDEQQLVNAFRQDSVADYFADHLADDGAISLVRVANAWSCLVPNLASLVGLHYEFLIEKAGGEPAEVVKDAWNSQICETSGLGNRRAVLDVSKFDFKNDDVARESDRRKWVIYQLHVGSVFGQAHNTQRSSFQDLLAQLKYFKDLGINTIQLLPTNAMENARDWGYQGASTLAAEESYGFVDEAGRFVCGSEAVRQFVDVAHGLGINVTCDVVHNHVAGENLLWNFDGEENIYFNWGKADDPKLVETPFGGMPAFSREAVRTFYRDHALHQIHFYHFDGLRFDCSKAMADFRPEDYPFDGSSIDLGDTQVNAGNPGWHALREMNLALKLMAPEFSTAAEQFPPELPLSTPHAAGGLGFDQQWNPAWSYAIRDLVQASAIGAPLPLDAWMRTLDAPAGIDANERAVWIISSHDEVNQNGRTIAQTQKAGADVATSLARMVMVLGLLNPGAVMFFQGDESLAANSYQWGRPDTWDTGWKWRTNPENDSEYARRDMHALTRATIALRARHIDAVLSPCFQPSFCEASGLVGYVRGEGQKKLFILANFGGESVAKENLVKPEGHWTEVFSSSAEVRSDVAINAHEVRIFSTSKA